MLVVKGATVCFIWENLLRFFFAEMLKSIWGDLGIFDHFWAQKKEWERKDLKSEVSDYYYFVGKNESRYPTIQKIPSIFLG